MRVSAFDNTRMSRSPEFEAMVARLRRPLPTMLTLLDSLTPNDLLKVMKKMNPTTYSRTRRASKQVNVFTERHVTVPTIKTENHQFNVTNLIDNPRKMIVLIQTMKNGRFTRYNLEDVDFRGFSVSNLCIQDFDFGSKDDFGMKDTAKEERIVKIADFLIMHGWTNVNITLPDTMLPIVEAVKTPHIFLDRCMEIDFDDISHVLLAEKKIFGMNANCNVRMWADRRMAPVRFITVMIKSFKEVEEATLEDRVVEMQNFVNHETTELPLHRPCRIVESEYCRWNDIYVKLWSATVEQEGRSASLIYYIVKRKRITLYSRFYPRLQQITAADIASSLDSYIYEEQL